MNITATVFRLPFTRYIHVTGSRAEVVATKFAEDDITPTSWAIREGGSVLSKDDNQWELEPSPSYRDDEFLARTRWSSASEAIAFANTHFTTKEAP
jgi:hypothetical protein